MMYLVKVRKINILGHFFNDVPNYKEVKIIVENINLFLSNYFITISINGFKLPMLLYYVKSYIWSVIVQFFLGGSNYKTNRVHHAGELGTQRTETSKYTYYKLFSCVCMILFLNPIKIYYIFFIRYRYTIT